MPVFSPSSVLHNRDYDASVGQGALAEPSQFIMDVYTINESIKLAQNRSGLFYIVGDDRRMSWI